MKRAGEWHAVALQIQGRTVLAEKVLESSVYKDFARETATVKEYLHHAEGLDVFAEVKR